MSDDTIRLVTIGRIIRRRRRFLITLAVVGALVGYGTSWLLPPRYTTSASVLLPGAWEERELMTQAQIAVSSVVLDRTATALGLPGVDGEELRDRVGAGVADGNIIKISGTADTPEGAQRLSDQAAQQFVTYAAQVVGADTDPEAASRPEALRKLVERTSRRITELADGAGEGRSVESVQTRTELAKLRTALQEAVDKLNRADQPAAKANMVVMGPSTRPTGEAPPTKTQLVAVGAVLFFLLAVLGHLATARMGRRLRTEPEIAAALGAPSLGTVEVPGERRADRAKGAGPGALARRLLGIDVRWDLPTPLTGDEASGRIRYRRVGARLREQVPAPLRLLVVVPEGDEPARRAAGELAAETAADPAPGGGHPAPRVVEVSVSQPMVRDRDDESGALVVLSAGSWTAGELSGIGEACADAGHDVVGVVVACTVRATSARSADRSRKKGAAPASSGAGRPTGGAE
ncbi:Wzz/FepE/Etk N-terminal domain-containing protein [Streptomyces sp. NPDC092359]|uniref:Wzz/FepE/Etk N-terminal domain-containing protein n=1 Tax=Streptomyces sp. NPDC092359 TaxID=3366014 RepID=UPI003830254B